MPPVDFRLGDVVRLKRPHPCGNQGNEDFEVVRLGADIGLKCTGCGHRILLARSALEPRVLQFVSRRAESELPSDIEPIARPGPPPTRSLDPTPDS